MSASASGASTGSGEARSREHNQGNQERRYTVEQKAAVLRIRRCSPTAFYDILDLESVKTTVTDSEIKKAYRKQSLLTHPDKNGHEHADEAFKMVSRAFGVLGDKEKRDKFDRFGTDPDSRFASAQAQNPFSGFANRQASGARGGGGGGPGMWQEEISPEEMFQRFFGGGGFGGFDTGPQFVFNFGGGPGVRVHQFGGARPQRRPRDANDQQGQERGGLQTFLGLLPILIFFILPLITSIFSGGDSAPSTPRMTFDKAIPPYTHKRQTPSLKVNYFVNPSDVSSYAPQKFEQLDRAAETQFIRSLRADCSREMGMRERLVEDAQGWFMVDQRKMERANNYEMPSCKRLEKLGVGR